jgi:hypothetical protein
MPTLRSLLVSQASALNDKLYPAYHPKQHANVCVRHPYRLAGGSSPWQLARRKR